MLATLLLVTPLLSLVNGIPVQGATAEDASGEDDTLPPAGPPQLTASTLHYVYAFFRHGIRSPSQGPYPTDPNKPKFYLYFKPPLSQLTKAGKEEMYIVGKKLEELYGDFVNGYSVEKVHASSTPKTRTIMTAETVLAGLFPPKKPLLKGLEKWQPIPIFQDSEVFDKVTFYNDKHFPQLALKECPRFGQMIQKGYDIVVGKDENPAHAAIYQLLQKYTEDPKINSIDSHYKLYDTLEMEKYNGLIIPDWATKPQPALGGKRLFPDSMRPLQVEWFYTTQWLNRNPEMLLFYSGPLFYSINERFRKKTNTNDIFKERFKLHATHDDTIYTLRWALGFDDPNFEVNLGDGIVFELHKPDEEYFVQVVYYHPLRNPEEFREVLQLPQCPSPCPLETFTKVYPSLSPPEWERKCFIPSIITSNVQQ